MFELYSDKINHKSYEVFEALDYDNSTNADFFKEKCSELDPTILISLRDKRKGSSISRNLLRTLSIASKMLK